MRSSYANDTNCANEKKQETIKTCIQEVKSFRTGFFTYLSAVFRAHGGHILLTQTAVLLFTVSGIYGSAPESLVGIVPLYIPLFVFAFLPSLLRGSYFRMDEIEAATRSAGVQLLLAKLLITGAADVVCFSVLLLAEWRTLYFRVSLLRLLLYMFVPYLLCLTVFLWQNRCGIAIRTCAVRTVFCGLMFCLLSYCLPTLYLPSMTVLWLGVFSVFFAFFAREIAALIMRIRKGVWYGTYAL